MNRHPVPLIRNPFPMEDALNNFAPRPSPSSMPPDDEQAVEAVRVKYLGRAGSHLPPERGDENARARRTSRASASSSTKSAPRSPPRIDTRKAALEEERDAAALAGMDTTLPGMPGWRGALHPMTQLLDRAVQIFRRMGFALADGPDIETEWHCFDALNTPADHPARNEQDTFYLPDGRLLRTQTSTIQIRTMETQPPPVRIIGPGAAYRRDEIDATHLAQFTQMEGLYVDEGVTARRSQGHGGIFLPRAARRLTPRSVSARIFSRSPSRASRSTSRPRRSAATGGSSSPAAAWSIRPSSSRSTHAAATTLTIPRTSAVGLSVSASNASP